MSQVRFISDYHFGHKAVAKWRGFNDVYQMNEHIIKKHNEVVKKKDITYILGDITMETDEWYFYLDQMKGRKIVILGNHDDPKYVPELLKYVEKVAGMVKYKGIFLTHCPIHTRELEYRIPINIHGHLHEYNVKTDKNVNDKRYINVCCEQIDYTPKTLKELGINR